MEKRLDGRKARKKYAFEIHSISDFYFFFFVYWSFIP